MYFKQCKEDIAGHNGRIKKWVTVTYSWFNNGCFGNWEFGNGKLLFGGHSSESLHLFHMPKCLMSNYQWLFTKATFFDLTVYMSCDFWKLPCPSYPFLKVCLCCCCVLQMQSCCFANLNLPVLLSWQSRWRRHCHCLTASCLTRIIT